MGRTEHRLASGRRLHWTVVAPLRRTHPRNVDRRCTPLRRHQHQQCVASARTSMEMVDRIPLQVLENTASAGDLILMHSLLLHAVPAAHLGDQPRFLLSTSIQQPYWTTPPVTRSTHRRDPVLVFETCSPIMDFEVTTALIEHGNLRLSR
jgi:hypothetical protein